MLHKVKDNLTDKTTCVVSPVGKPHVQISANNLYIAYRGRGGVQGFQYRIDDGPVSAMQLPTSIEREMGAVRLSGEAFNQALCASRLRVRVLTSLSSLQEDDLPLSGMHHLYDKMRRECPN
jgi:hypothetical protein